MSVSVPDRRAPRTRFAARALAVVVSLGWLVLGALRAVGVVVAVAAVLVWRLDLDAFPRLAWVAAAAAAGVAVVLLLAALARHRLTGVDADAKALGWPSPAEARVRVLLVPGGGVRSVRGRDGVTICVAETVATRIASGPYRVRPEVLATFVVSHELDHFRFAWERWVRAVGGIDDALSAMTRELRGAAAHTGSSMAGIGSALRTARHVPDLLPRVALALLETVVSMLLAMLLGTAAFLCALARPCRFYESAVDAALRDAELDHDRVAWADALACGRALAPPTLRVDLPKALLEVLTEGLTRAVHDSHPAARERVDALAYSTIEASSSVWARPPFDPLPVVPEAATPSDTLALDDAFRPAFSDPVDDEAARHPTSPLETAPCIECSRPSAEDTPPRFAGPHGLLCRRHAWLSTVLDDSAEVVRLGTEAVFLGALVVTGAASYYLVGTGHMWLSIGLAFGMLAAARALYPLAAFGSRVRSVGPAWELTWRVTAAGAVASLLLLAIPVATLGAAHRHEAEADRAVRAARVVETNAAADRVAHERAASTCSVESTATLAYRGLLHPVPSIAPTTTSLSILGRPSLLRSSALRPSPAQQLDFPTTAWADPPAPPRLRPVEASSPGSLPVGLSRCTARRLAATNVHHVRLPPPVPAWWVLALAALARALTVVATIALLALASVLQTAIAAAWAVSRARV